MEKNKENKEKWLNEFGLLIWKHKTNKRLFLHRYYYWVDRVTLIDEDSDSGRQIIQDFKHSTFNYLPWELISKEEEQKVKNSYIEIYK
jgi:hypothetical protein